MRFVRAAGIVLAAIVLALAGVGVAARFSDGPIAIFAGGPLSSGELATGPEPDWSFARDISEMEFQLLEPPRSRTTWLLVHEGRLYVPCGYMDTSWGRLWKRWPHEAERDGRAVVRIDGKRYERQVVRVTDPELFRALAAELRRKYVASMGEPSPEALWLYELAPRTSS